MSEKTYAAVDLGSNSFHLLLARMEGAQMQVIDRLKEMVRLAGGLDKDGNLTEESQQLALSCLERFGQRLRDIPAEQVRIVGTNTLRKAKNSKTFLQRAEAAVGHRIDVVSGREEARLLYLGVAHSLPSDQGRRLVVDIGGGSTELIVGEKFSAKLRESLHMGCVSMTQTFFADGKISKSNWKKAVTHAMLELRPILQDYTQAGWQIAVGSSGTMRSTADVLESQGWSTQGITREGLEQLKKQMLKLGEVAKLSELKGLSSDRAPVFAGGVAIIEALFESFGLKEMSVAAGALREGLIYDLGGRSRHKDIRARGIDHLVRLYHVDTRQAGRVSDLLKQILKLGEDTLQFSNEEKNLLFWAAQLHELGLVIAHSQYHKHGAYLIEHADTPGFSNQEQAQLAFLIRAQRRKFPHDLLQTFSPNLQPVLMLLAVMLRLALVLRRDRSDTSIKLKSVTLNKPVLSVEFESGWLESHPLYKADLEQEADYLDDWGFTLQFS
jgi:exopolyphosphatase/guanosine-5'-triphosphate,3'-diphosphate pyrophosphatase